MNAAALLAAWVAVTLTAVALADEEKWVWARNDGGGQPRADSRVGAASEEVTRVAKPLLRDPQLTAKPQVLFQAANNPRVDTKHYK